MQSIGIFGGTFDPVHSGHLALACQVRDRFALDQLLIVPALEPPHKRQPVASFTHRVAMLDAALQDCSDCERICCSRIEQSLSRPSYTIHTVEAVLRSCAVCHTTLIIGMDSLADLPNWYRVEDLLARVDLVAVNREQTSPAAIRELVVRLQPRYQPTPAHNNAWINHAGRTLTLLPDFHQPFSSTAIRQALGRGEEAAGLPEAVRTYIHTHRLYSHPSS